MKVIIKKILLALVVGLVSSLLLGFPLMLLWNWLMPLIFELKEITFLQSTGLVFLSSILFRDTSSSKE